MNTKTDLTVVFICGSALRGQPDHGNLSGAIFLGSASTASRYRLHAVGDGWHPGIYQVDDDGIAISGELYGLTIAQFQHLVGTEPPHMYPQAIQLADGSSAIAFLYPRGLVEEHGWPDISHHGGWAAYKAASSAG